MSAGRKRLAAGAAILAVASAASWLALDTAPVSTAAASVAVRPAADYGPQLIRLLVESAQAAGRQQADAAAARARHVASVRALEHAAHVAHVAHERRLAQLAADAAAARAAHRRQFRQDSAAAYPQPSRPAVQPPPSSAGRYSFAGLERLWVSAGGPAWAQSSAASVAECESGGNPRAYNPSGASGLWQILGQVTGGYVFDPMVNAENAVAKFEASGDTWAQWVCKP